jgi:hypothetical protein
VKYIGDPKVKHLGVVLMVKQNVGWHDVKVDYSMSTVLVQVAEPSGRIISDI